MKKLIFLVIALPLLLSSCGHKESISEKLIGTWKTDWSESLDKPFDKIDINEGISFFKEKGEDDKGTFETAFIGTVIYKQKKTEIPVEFIVTVSGRWSVVDGNDLVLRYDLTKLDVNVSHIKVDSNTVGAMGDVAKDLITGNWTRAINRTIDTFTADDFNEVIDQEAKTELSKFFRETLDARNKGKVTYEDVEIDDMNMICNPGGFFSSKLTFYRTDKDPVHLINNVNEFEKEVEKEMVKEPEIVQPDSATIDSFLMMNEIISTDSVIVF